MTQTFNPAPGWPPAPEGFVPGPGWRPDPSWPPAPAGWRFWVEDEPVDERPVVQPPVVEPRGDDSSSRPSAPEGTRLAPHGRRIVALLVDSLVLPVHVLWLAFAGRWVFQLEPSTGFFVVLLICFGASLAVISGTSVWLTGGQTLGKAIVGLTERRVGRDPSQDLRGLGWSLGRHSVGYLVIDVFGAGGLVAFGTPRRQALHDLVFGSEVVHEPGAALVGQSWAERGKAFADRLETGLEASRERYGWVSSLWRWQAKLILLVAGIVWGVANLLGKVGLAAASATPGTTPASSVPAAAPVSAKVAAAIVVPTTFVTGAAVVAIAADTAYQNVNVVYNFGTIGQPNTQEIYLAQADGDDIRRLTDDSSHDRDPDLFRDRVVVFSSERDGNSSLYTMTAEGTDVRRLTEPSGEDRDPDWSPDGERIAFTRVEDDRWTVWVMAADGSSARALGDGGEPGWSPDGERIVFVSSRHGNPEIYVMDAHGSHPERLTDDEGADFGPAWSPDGDAVVFTSQRDGNQEIYVMDANGEGKRRLTDHPKDDFNAFWSPDGGKILFRSGRGLENEGDEMWAMDPDGSDPVQLTHQNQDDR